METRDLDRIRFVTRHFNDLQGLQYWAPLGLITLAWTGTTLLRAVLLLGALLLILGARRYYRNTFGEVEHEPATELQPVSVFSPAGPMPQLQDVEQVTPILRHFLVTVALAVVLFSFFQAIPPNFLVQGGESPGQHPRILLEPAPYLGPPIMKFYPNGAESRSPSMVKAVVAQTMYVLYGSLFLGLWLWRERRRSQSHHLALAVLLLGLSALGTSLGYLARKDGEIPPFIDSLLPALVYPGLALLLCGSSAVLAGLLDHWQLVRALGRPVAQEED
ncbi:MAG TPA: hypothetical protein VF756_04270 [Thermoanaerobaculia bacterium]